MDTYALTLTPARARFVLAAVIAELLGEQPDTERRAMLAVRDTLQAQTTTLTLTRADWWTLQLWVERYAVNGERGEQIDAAGFAREVDKLIQGPPSGRVAVPDVPAVTETQRQRSLF